MRKYSTTKTFSLLGLSIAAMSFAQSQNENYVQSRSCLNDDCSRKSETITYFDGLGRPKQIISVKATPGGKDLVTPVTYDGFGRQVKNILPVPADTQNSSIHTGITDETAANSYYGVSNAYSEKEMENSPLDRVLQQASPGEPWKMSSGHTQKLKYETNLGTEVKKFITSTTTSTVSNVSTTVSTLSVSTDNSGYYPASTLYKNTVTDEDGNPVTEFKNGQGQTILVRRNDGAQNVDTYYVYNEYNQLAFVLSPKAVKQISDNNNLITDDILNELCYQYRYDGRDRLVEKRLPGKEWELMVYDKQDRVVLTQDAILRTANNSFGSKGWLFTKYDEFGRVALTGFYPDSNSRSFVQDQMNTIAANSLNNEIRTTEPVVVSGISIYYRNLAFPSSGVVLLSVNYYDTYPPEAPAVPVMVLGQHTMKQTLGSSEDASTMGILTAAYVKNIEDNNWTKTYSYYDSTGRAIATKSTNHLGGYTNTETELDFAGVPKLSKTYHKRLSTDTEKVITETFEYDSQNRLKKHYHQVDNNPQELLAENTYNDLSQLVNKKVGNNLQSIDYTYNIRGWMTKINDPANLDGKLFGYEIKYANPSSTGGRYNGNISSIDWKKSVTPGEESTLRRYEFQYDSLNRLQEASFSTPDSTIPINNFFNESIQYDLNGNITHLLRTAPSFYGNSAELVDNLDYYYEGNKLIRIDDETGNPTGYEGGNNNNGYDINGNMISMPDKKIDEIRYNHLNLPNQLKIDGYNKSLSYLYRADGTKLKKSFITSKDNSVMYSSSTEYLDGFHYASSTGDELWWAWYKQTGEAYEPEAFINMIQGLSYNNVLKFVPTAEGFYDFENNEYIYQYKDHLGNVRVSYKKGEDNSKPILTDSNDYYPFGMNFIRNPEAEAYFGTGSYKNYKFQEQELQETGFYSFKWRNYMPDVGRFFNIDPLSEKYSYQSHYNFSENAVISYRELEGLEKVLAIFYTGGFQGGGTTIPKSSFAGTAGQLFDYASSNAKSKGYEFKGAIIAPGIVYEPSVSKGMDFIKTNYEKGDLVITYGYSYGADSAMRLGSELKDENIPVELSMIVDSSDGFFKNSTLKTNVSDNTKTVLNTYQTTPDPTTTAKGEPLTADNKNKTTITNTNLTSKETNHLNIDEKALDSNKKAIDKALPNN